MYNKVSTVLELGRCKVSAEGLNGERGHAILLTIASWAAGETVISFPRSLFVKYICEWTGLPDKIAARWLVKNTAATAVSVTYRLSALVCERGKSVSVSPAAQLAIVSRIACSPRPHFKPSAETFERPNSETVDILICMYEAKLFFSSIYIDLQKKKFWHLATFIGVWLPKESRSYSKERQSVTPLSVF